MELLLNLAMVVAVSLIGAIVVWAAWYRRVALQGPPTAPDVPQTCAGCAQTVSKLLLLEGELANVKAAVAEGISHVDRVENRIMGAVKRARKELRDSGAEHPGLEAEAAELSLVHGEGSPSQTMPLMPDVVEQPQSSVPGVTPEQLRRVRGM